MSERAKTPAPGLTWQAKLACLRRELALRRNVYPGMVARNRMKKALADREIELMAAIVAEYEAAAGAVEASVAGARAARAAALEEAAAVVDAYDRTCLANPAPEIAMLVRALKMADSK